jgi:hypothetical protein
MRQVQQAAKITDKRLEIRTFTTRIAFPALEECINGGRICNGFQADYSLLKLADQIFKQSGPQQARSFRYFGSVNYCFWKAIVTQSS